MEAATSNQELSPPPPPPEYSVSSLALQDGALRPTARGGATLTQVGENGAVYLIGGATREAVSFGDVHRFHLDALQWELMTPTSGSLPPRSGHSAVAIGTGIVVFGGLDAIAGQVYNDVHVFDTCTKSWRQMQVDGEAPLARNAHAAIVLPTLETTSTSRRVLVYGGSSPESGALDELFLLHVSMGNENDTTSIKTLRWEKLSAVGECPEARELHCALLQSDTTVCFAGGRNRDGKICTDMALLALDRWEWQIVPMCEWNRCSLAAGVLDGQLLSFGGWDGHQICGDCWRYADDEESWLPVTQQTFPESKQPSDPATPSSWADIPERFGHCGATVLLPSSPSEVTDKSRRQALLIFGGMNASSDLNDLVLICT